MTMYPRDVGGSSDVSQADDLSAILGVDVNDLVPQPAWMRRPKAGMFAFSKITAKTPACVRPQFSRFFAKNYPAASRIAAQYGVDVALPLGLAANESGWGRSGMARIKNNPFGATPDGVNPVTYDSVSSAWDKWGQQWGRRIKGAGSDADQFLKELVKDNRHAQDAADNRGPYNTQTIGHMEVQTGYQTHAALLPE